MSIRGGITRSPTAPATHGVILETVRGTEGVLADPAQDVLLMELASPSVNLRVRWWIAPPQRADALDARDEVLTAVKHRLMAHGIDRPFPTQQILFHDQTEHTDGDRVRRRGGGPASRAHVSASRTVADAIAQISQSRPRGVDGE